MMTITNLKDERLAAKASGRVPGLIERRHGPYSAGSRQRRSGAKAVGARQPNRARLFNSPSGVQNAVAHANDASHA
jgi:hypothetical protein